MRSWFKFLGAIFVAFSLTGCGAMLAQNPSEGYGPVNVFPGPNGETALLGGADLVAYFTEGTYRQGNSEFKTDYKGVPVLFSTQEHLSMFKAEPEKYLPQYGGYCANGIMFGIPWGGNATNYRLVDGKLYTFGGEVSQAAFELDLEPNIALADKYWAEEIEGNNSFVQRAKRLVFRVPHYQSGAEQAEMVKQAR